MTVRRMAIALAVVAMAVSSAAPARETAVDHVWLSLNPARVGSDWTLAGWPTQATGHRVSANSATFEDAVGEDPAGPDITTVSVSNDDAGELTFRVALPSHPILTEDLRIRIWLDYDDDPATGLDGLRNGLDHFLLVNPGSLGVGEAGLFVCQPNYDQSGQRVGSMCSGGRESAMRASLRFSYDKGAVFSFDSEKLKRTEPFTIGSLKRFRFLVEVWSGIRYDPATRTWDFTNAHWDFAPTEKQFPSRDEYWVYESRPLLVKSFSATPATPRAGGSFALRLAAIRTDTGAALTSGTVSCSFKLAGQTLRPRSARFVGRRAVCVFAIPTSARGRRFRTAISVQSGGTRLTRSLSGRVA